MKFKVKTHDFQKAINSVEGVITAREIKSALSNIKVETGEKAIFLSATDLEISLKTSVEAEVFETGSISLPARQLSNAFKTINFEHTMLETDQEYPTQTIITDADSKIDFRLNINGIDADEIKTIGTVDMESIFELPCRTFLEMIRKTSYAVALEDTRFVFNGLFVLSKGEHVSFIGTDGRRLAKVDRVFPNKIPFDSGIIIPHKAVREIQKMIELNEFGRVGIIDKQIYIAIGNVELLCKLIDGTYPDYDSVIPKSSSENVRINKDSFQIALKQALIAAEEPSRQIRLRFVDNHLHINSSTPGSTEININIPVEYNSDETIIAFKGDYLIDVVKSIDDSELTVEFSGSNAPVLFRDPSDEEYLSVIMPMKL
ncbi:MAG: DNA polymerase III subunit beta [Leptospiraceae bacterium]|nr:DNA polymerase III subunit beta [Leptospiraceae bacterium]MCP5498726.1 DNA polymerase III subunit beta [Leptospiraceae bacterium]